MNSVSLNGIELAFEEIGSGSRVLLLTHGYGATSAMFAANVAAIATRNQVLTWDIRGHGGSDYPADPAEPGARPRSPGPSASRPSRSSGCVIVVLSGMLPSQPAHPPRGNPPPRPISRGGCYA